MSTPPGNGHDRERGGIGADSGPGLLRVRRFPPYRAMAGVDVVLLTPGCVGADTRPDTACPGRWRGRRGCPTEPCKCGTDAPTLAKALQRRYGAAMNPERGRGAAVGGLRRKSLRCLTIGACTVVALGAPPAALAQLPSSGPQLNLTMEGITTPVDAPVDPEQLRNDGTADIRVSVLANGKPGAKVTSQGEGFGRFLRFPVSPAVRGPQATVRITPQRDGNGGDALMPGRRSFTFGADVRYEGDPTSPSGKGNNVLQRGFWGSSQYKLQVDSGRLTCRLAGDDGHVIVPRLAARQPLVVEPGRWYRVRCTVSPTGRDDGRADVTVSLTPLGDPEAEQTKRADAVRLGAINPTARHIDIGGRTPRASAGNDQFEGSVDNVVIDIR